MLARLKVRRVREYVFGSGALPGCASSDEDGAKVCGLDEKKKWVGVRIPNGDYYLYVRKRKELDDDVQR
eukprot:evm.model.scf_215EXC.6 EVM.evm.TU.scf_215EXC.6   scf_215EXC:79655-80326(+)